jgi:hypothetical protein
MLCTIQDEKCRNERSHMSGHFLALKAKMLYVMQGLDYLFFV